MNNNVEQFNNNVNISLLWDVLLDEFINVKDSISITDNTRLSIIENIRVIFNTNINMFVSKINPNLSIIELNKQFLRQVSLAINELIPNLRSHTNTNIKKIVIAEDDVQIPYKIEDIHEVRKTEFQRTVEKKKLEFDALLNPPPPKNIQLADNINNSFPSIDLLMAEKMKEREQYSSVSNSSVEHIIPDKKVTWTDDTTFFNKLKKMNTSSNSSLLPSNAIYPNNDKDYTKYIEQPSISLNQIQPLNPIINTIQTPSETIMSSIPVLSNSELLKQFKIINEKIDNLYQLFHSISKTNNIHYDNTNNDYTTNEMENNKES